MDKIIEIINKDGKTVGIATTETRAHQLRHSIKIDQPLKTPIEAQMFLAAVMQQAAVADNFRDQALFTDCLYRLREIFKETSNSDNKTQGVNE